MTSRVSAEETPVLRGKGWPVVSEDCGISCCGLAVLNSTVSVTLAEVAHSGRRASAGSRISQFLGQPHVPDAITTDSTSIWGTGTRAHGGRDRPKAIGKLAAELDKERISPWSLWLVPLPRPTASLRATWGGRQSPEEGRRPQETANGGGWGGGLGEAR